MRGLIDADVRFDAADENVTRTRAFDLGAEGLCAARAEGSLLDNLKRGRQHGLDLTRRMSQSAWVLLRDDQGYVEQLRRVRDERDARRVSAKSESAVEKPPAYRDDQHRRADQLFREHIVPGNHLAQNS